MMGVTVNVVIVSYVFLKEARAPTIKPLETISSHRISFQLLISSYYYHCQVTALITKFILMLYSSTLPIPGIICAVSTPPT